MLCRATLSTFLERHYLGGFSFDAGVKRDLRAGGADGVAEWLFLILLCL